MNETQTRVVDPGHDGKVQLATVLDAALAAKVRAYAAEDGRSVSNALAALIRRALAEQTPVGAGWQNSEVR